MAREKNSPLFARAAAKSGPSACSWTSGDAWMTGVNSSHPRSKLDVLTAKEREAIDLVFQGMITTQIAKELGASTAAIQGRISVALRRLGADDRGALMRMVCPELLIPTSLPPLREPTNDGKPSVGVAPADNRGKNPAADVAAAV